MSGSSQGWLGPAAAALERERVPRAPERSRHERRRLAQLGRVVAAGGHRERQAVGREHEPRVRAARLRDRLEGRRHALHERLHEARVVVERAQLVDLRGARADLGARALDVLEILAAARVRAVGRREERERARRRRPRPSAAACRRGTGASCGCPSRPAAAGRAARARPRAPGPGRDTARAAGFCRRTARSCAPRRARAPPGRPCRGRRSRGTAARRPSLPARRRKPAGSRRSATGIDGIVSRPGRLGALAVAQRLVDRLPPAALGAALQRVLADLERAQLGLQLLVAREPRRVEALLRDAPRAPRSPARCRGRSR